MKRSSEEKEQEMVSRTNVGQGTSISLAFSLGSGFEEFGSDRLLELPDQDISKAILNQTKSEKFFFKLE